ncbi:MAG: hypothetical protein H7256_01815 [Bdellovibrio sp.]|nr:hypothetical protein [Bdellovibrio sp.]
MWQIKYFIFEAADKKRNSVQLKIKRNRKELTVNEPLADFSGYVYSDENLLALRKSVNSSNDLSASCVRPLPAN